MDIGLFFRRFFIVHKLLAWVHSTHLVVLIQVGAESTLLFFIKFYKFRSPRLNITLISDCVDIEYW